MLVYFDSDRLASVARATWESRPDLRSVFPNPDLPAYRDWVYEHGFGEESELAQSFPVFPDLHQIRRVVGEHATQEDFHLGGCVIGRQVFSIIGERFRRTRLSFLDYGGGYGRIPRYLGCVSDLDLHLTDIDAGAVTWCQRELGGFLSTFRPEELLPVSEELGGFDVVFCYSVFTHLCESACLALMRRLLQSLAPGGILIVTLMGGAALRKTLMRRGHGVIRGKLRFLTRVPRYLTHGFFFTPYGNNPSSIPENQEYFSQVDLDAYGVSFAGPRWLDRVARELSCRCETNVATDGWQDWHVLTRME